MNKTTKTTRIFHAKSGLYELSLHEDTNRGGLTLITGMDFGLLQGFYIPRKQVEKLADALHAWLDEHKPA